MAFDAFLKISGIPGESTDDKHKDWIEILSFSTGVKQPTSVRSSTSGGLSAERADFADFSITKAVDKASPKLALYCANGQHIPEITIELCRAAGNKQKYLEYKLHASIVNSVRPAGTAKATETLPIEEVSFKYGKITWSYIETDHKSGRPKGKVEAYWNLVENTGG